MTWHNTKASFTLIELLIVIAIVAVLSVVVVLTLNPAELLKQARDSNRLSDLQTLNKAFSIYETDTLGTGSLGQASTTYFSLIDPTATTTAGTLCEGVGLTPPPNWTYRCAASSTYRKVDGTGWIPLNFTQVSSGAPLGQLPVDPQNTTSTAYYSYTPGGSWALTALLESQKHLRNTAATDGGYDPGRYEAGSNVELVARSQGLVGLWPLDESAGTTANDRSGNGNSGTITGGVTLGQPGKVGSAMSFDGSSGYISMSNPSSLSLTSQHSLIAWVKLTRKSPGGDDDQAIIAHGSSLPLLNVYGPSRGSAVGWVEYGWNGAGWFNENKILVDDDQWHHLAVTWDGTTQTIYVDGLSRATNVTSTAPITNTDGFHIGRFGTARYPKGLVDDARVYSRALSAAEIKAIYDATK